MNGNANSNIKKYERPQIWKTICSIDDGLLPLICGATISTSLSMMLESTFKWERFLSGVSMLLASTFVFLWYVCLSRIKRDIAENARADESRILDDKTIWDKYYLPMKVKMRICIFFVVLFLIIWGFFLATSIQNNSSVDTQLPSDRVFTK